MSRYDDALLRIYLANMPLGVYHVRDDQPWGLFHDGKMVALVDCNQERYAKGAAGLVSALVYLLNTREQTRIE